MSGRVQVDGAVSWIKTHRTEFLALQKLCVDAEARRDDKGNPVYRSITCASVYMLAEQMGLRLQDDPMFRRNKNLWSTLSRYMLEFHPQLERVIRLRNCSVGEYVNAHGLPELGEGFVYRGRMVA